jgi:hypothetical protein
VVYLKKVSLYIDEELWTNFKENVLRKHGTLRKLSSEVEESLRHSLVCEELLLGSFKKIGINSDVSVTSEKIKRNRPRLRGPPSEILIREMRRALKARLKNC